MSARPIHVSRLLPHPANVRADLGDLTELAASIAEQGILQPLVAEARPDGKYTVLAGHRRLAAAKKARLEMVPVIVRPTAKPGKAIEVMLVENCQRADLSAVEKARAMGRLRDLGYTAAAIAKTTGLSASTVSYYLSLLDLDEATLVRVTDGHVSVGHAVAAVRKARKVRRGGTAGRPVQAAPAWFTGRHKLASAVRAMCDHPTRPVVGNVGCGQCWERAIRDDAAEPEPVRLSPRQERMEALASMRLHDGNGPAVPGAVTAAEAAERLGVTLHRTVQARPAQARGGGVMTAAVRDRRGEHTPPEQGARAKAVDHQCTECHGPTHAVVTVWVEHDPKCTIGQHVERVRAAAKARA